MTLIKSKINKVMFGDIECVSNQEILSANGPEFLEFYLREMFGRTTPILFNKEGILLDGAYFWDYQEIVEKWNHKEMKKKFYG